MNLTVATVCTGIGSPEQALKDLGIPHNISFACEIDKFARKTYLSNFTPSMMVEDMTKESWEGEQFYSDLFIGGIPCQAFSLAGKRMGELDKRGLLFYDFYRYVKVQQPKFFIIENVRGLLSMDKGKVFANWKALLGQSENGMMYSFPHEDSLMYNLHWQVLNTKDYGLPQNRERVFLIGIRNDLPNSFVFPKGVQLKLRLKDILEPEVDEKYYLSENNIAALVDYNKRQVENGCGFSAKFRDVDEVEIMDTLNVGGGGKDDLVKIKVQSATKSGYEIATEGDSINLEHPDSQTRRGRVGKQVAQTLTTSCNQGVMIGAMRGRNPENPSDRTTGAPTQQMLEINENGTSNCLTSVQKDNLVVEGIIQLNNPKHSNDRIYSDEGLSPTLNTMQDGNRQPFIQNDYRIRRLTPLECFRLQGYPDSFVNSNYLLENISKQGINLYFCKQLLKDLKCHNAPLKNAIESTQQKDIASCTIKDSKNTETQILFSNTPIESTQFAKSMIAIDLFSPQSYAQGTITHTENTGIQFLWTQEKSRLEPIIESLEDVIGKDKSKNTELILRITLDENLKQVNTYTTSILINTIMKFLTCIYADKSNTIKFIINYKKLQANCTKRELLVLKTENISFVSNTQLYKQAGNSISVPVMREILKNLLRRYMDNH